MRPGAQTMLVTVGMISEGYDLRDIDCVLMGRSTDSERIFVQQMGRALRKAPGKDVVYILDMCANLRHRWIRLEQEQGTAHVKDLISQFWPVSGVQ